MSSPIQPIEFNGHSFYVKRDDLFCPVEDEPLGLNGNKARKLHYYLKQDLPEVSRLVSYGSAQSNMLYSLSCLAKLKGWQLDFYTDHIADNLLRNPRGNYAAALANGAKVHAVGKAASAQQKNMAAYVQKNCVQDHYVKDDLSLFIPEGGRSEFAEQGVKILAEEINQWVIEKGITNPKVMLPSGTGTSALYLQKHLPFEVFTCACVGSADYLEQQFFELSENKNHHPTIIAPPKDAAGNTRKYHFGKCYSDFYRIWQELQQQTNICFELLYDPLGWLCLMEYVQQRSEGVKAFDEKILYIHQGGLLGNQSMIPRYQRRA